jgi:hypothetical protein
MTDVDQFVVGKYKSLSQNKCKILVVMMRNFYFANPRPQLSYFYNQQADHITKLPENLRSHTNLTSPKHSKVERHV